jgi:hypothetical protein
MADPVGGPPHSHFPGSTGFTGGVSPSPEVPAPSPGAPTPLPAGRPWSPWREARRDWRWGAGVIGVLAVVGVPLGLLWWALAPRADYRITGSGPVVIGNPSEELLVADDGVFVIVVAVLGLLAGVLTWMVRRRRGVAGLLAVALGTLAGSAVAWQIGELLGPGPSKAALAHVGGRVTTSLTLGTVPALAVAPFVALLVWLVATLYSRGDSLGRPAPITDAPAAAEPVDAEREPVER